MKFRKRRMPPTLDHTLKCAKGYPLRMREWGVYGDCLQDCPELPNCEVKKRKDKK